MCHGTKAGAQTQNKSGPEGWAQTRKVGPRRLGGMKFRVFFPLPPYFRSFVFLCVSSRGFLVVFEALEPSNVPVWALGLSCEAPAAPQIPPKGDRTNHTCIPGVCFDLSCSRLGLVSDFVSLEFSTYFECPRVFVWLKAKHTCTCDGFFLTAAVLVTCPHSSRVVIFFVRRDDISPDVVCPQDGSFLLWWNHHGELLSLHQR